MRIIVTTLRNLINRFMCHTLLFVFGVESGEGNSNTGFMYEALFISENTGSP